MALYILGMLPDMQSLACRASTRADVATATTPTHLDRAYCVVGRWVGRGKVPHCYWVLIREGHTGKAPRSLGAYCVPHHLNLCGDKYLLVCRRLSPGALSFLAQHRSLMDKLGAILESYAAKGERPGGDELLGPAFVVVNRDGESKQEGERTRFTSMGGRASSLIMHDSGVVYRGAAADETGRLQARQSLHQSPSAGLHL